MNKMIKVSSDKLIYAFLAVSLAYMYHIASTAQHFFIMLFFATAFPAVAMLISAQYKKWEERKRRANYYVNRIKR